MGAFKRTGLPVRAARLREFCVGTWIVRSRPLSRPRNITPCEEKPRSAVISRNYWLMQAGFLPPAKARPVFLRLHGRPAPDTEDHRCRVSRRPRARLHNELVLTGPGGSNGSPTVVCHRRRNRRR